jgi:hypothetical protein
MSEPSDAAALVPSLLASAGIVPSDEELALFRMMYPLLRQKADRIYELDLGDEPL